MSRTNRYFRCALAILLGVATQHSVEGRVLRLADVQGAPGSTVTAVLTLDDAAGLASSEFRINFDRNLLTFINATNLPGTLGGEFAMDIDPGDGVLVVRLYRDSHLPSGAGDLVTLSFGVNLGAELGMTAPLILAGADLVNQYGADLRWTSAVTVESAQFTVTNASSANMLFTRQAGPGGSITGDNSGQYSLNRTLTVTAVPAPYFFFTGWSGDTEGDTNGVSMTVVLDRPQAITAHFAPYLTQNTGTPHWWLAQNGLTNQAFDIESALDMDNDGFMAWQEYVAGSIPTNPDSYFLALIALSNDVPWVTWTPDLGSARLYMVEGKTNVTDTVWGPTNAASRFFRVKVELP